VDEHRDASGGGRFCDGGDVGSLKKVGIEPGLVVLAEIGGGTDWWAVPLSWIIEIIHQHPGCNRERGGVVAEWPLSAR
jgi:hypothetical protein